MATILTHPKMGDRSFDDAHAKRLMSLVNNGGWEYKKQGRGAAKSPAFSKQDDVATANASTDTRTAEIPEEEGGN